jgi:REP element-mobilizing transposase RayT
MIQNYHPEFLTATILEWKPLLANDEYKMIVVDSMQWLVENKRCSIHAFVIMPNHIHLLWKITDGYKREDVQGALFSFTGHAFKKSLKQKGSELNLYKVNDADREFQFWERNPMIKECFSQDFYLQKLDYIHHNPCQPKWKLVDLPEKYPWSSASFYELQDMRFSWLTHYNE